MGYGNNNPGYVRPGSKEWDESRVHRDEAGRFVSGSSVNAAAPSFNSILNRDFEMDARMHVQNREKIQKEHDALSRKIQQQMDHARKQNAQAEAAIRRSTQKMQDNLNRQNAAQRQQSSAYSNGQIERSTQTMAAWQQQHNRIKPVGNSKMIQWKPR